MRSSCQLITKVDAQQWQKAQLSTRSRPRGAWNEPRMHKGDLKRHPLIQISKRKLVLRLSCLWSGCSCTNSTSDCCCIAQLWDGAGKFLLEQPRPAGGLRKILREVICSLKGGGCHPTKASLFGWFQQGGEAKAGKIPSEMLCWDPC